MEQPNPPEKFILATRIPAGRAVVGLEYGRPVSTSQYIGYYVSLADQHGIAIARLDSIVEEPDHAIVKAIRAEWREVAARGAAAVAMQSVFNPIGQRCEALTAHGRRCRREAVAYHPTGQGGSTVLCRNHQKVAYKGQLRLWRGEES